MADFSEVFSFVREFARNDPRFLDNLRRRYRRFAFFASLGAPLMAMLSRPNRSAKYTFVGRRMGQLIRGLPSQDVQVLGNQLDYLFCRKYGIPFVSNCGAWPAITRAFASFGTQPAALSGLEKVAQVVSGRCAGTLVLSNDSLPVERLMVMAGRRVGARSICIQDGLMLRNGPSNVHGKFADHMFVFNVQQRDVFCAKGVAANKIQVMGFHSDYPGPESFPELRAGSARKICVLGQPMSLFYPHLSEQYLKLIGKVFSSLEPSGCAVVYKPHPREEETAYRRHFPAIFSGSLQEAFQSFDVFISLNSTALLEATLCGRIALQIRDNAFYDDDFERCGIAHSICSSDMESLAQLVCVLGPFRSEQMRDMVKGDVVQRFLDAHARLNADAQ